MNLDDIPEPSEEDLVQSEYLVRAYSRVDENQDYNLKSSVRVIAHLVRQGRILASCFCEDDFEWHEEEVQKAINTFEELE